MSPLARWALAAGLEERYIMGGTRSFRGARSFIGSDHLFPFYLQIESLCRYLYGSSFADPRPLSGMNAVALLLMSLTEPGDRIMLLSPDAGGHASIPGICRRLGLISADIPFDYEEFTVASVQANEQIENWRPRLVLLAPSDILRPPPLEQLSIPNSSILLYDATQTLGLIAGKELPSPFDEQPRLILFGGTHKTLPGPTKGLVLGKAEDLVKVIEPAINPQYIRNTQMSQVLSLLVTLVEARRYGKEYSQQIVQNARCLALALSELGFDVMRLPAGEYTRTHQVHVRMDEQATAQFFSRALRYGITLNKKQKALFAPSGIRLGVQEVTRYGWGREEMLKIAKILAALRDQRDKLIPELLSSLPGSRSVKFCCPPEEAREFLAGLEQY